eukprot:2602355-Amphidinium_carterae.1
MKHMTIGTDKHCEQTVGEFLDEELAAARTPRSADVLGKVAVAIARSGRAGQDCLRPHTTYYTYKTTI